MALTKDTRKGRAPLARGGGSRIRTRLIGLAISIAAGVSLIISGADNPLEQALREQRDFIREQPASGEVAIVEIDARSLAAHSQWPWPRRIYAELIDALRREDVHTLAFDVDFSARSNPADDALMAAALERFGGSAVLPTFRQQISDGAVSTIENLPIPELRAHAFLGGVNVFADPDGRLRRYSYGVMTGGVPRPSLAAHLAGVSGHIGSDFAIDYAIDPAQIPRFSLVDVIEGRVPKGALRGKRVVVGATAIELGDRYAIPRYGVQPGVVAQALAAETLIQRTTNPSHGPLPALLLALGATVMMLSARSRLRRLAARIGGFTVILGAPLALETLKLGTLEIAPALGALTAGLTFAVVLDVLRTLTRTRLTDPETGLSNRQAFMLLKETRGAGLVVARFKRLDDHIAILGRTDHLQLMNLLVDRLKVAAGAERLYRIDRSSFAWTIEGGSGELPSLLDGCTALLRAPVLVAGRPLLLQPSLGVAPVEAGCSAGETLARASIAAQSAEARGSAWLLHDEALSKTAGRTLSLLGQLTRSLAAGHFWVAYQAKLDLPSDRIKGAEALIRWDHPEYGPVSPAEFIPLFETEGMVDELSLYVLDQVTSDLQKWGARGLRPRVAINMSTILLGDEAFMQRLLSRLDQSADLIPQLTIEVTETAALAGAQAVVENLRRLRSLGLTISVDDYGTGQSTLSYLRNFPAHEIKIDQSFVRQITTDPVDRILVRSTIELAHQLGLSVVAEGVEDAESLELLRSFSCDTIQGWVIGRPERAETFIASFARSLTADAA